MIIIGDEEIISQFINIFKNLEENERVKVLGRVFKSCGSVENVETIIEGLNKAFYEWDNEEKQEKEIDFVISESKIDASNGADNYEQIECSNDKLEEDTYDFVPLGDITFQEDYTEKENKYNYAAVDQINLREQKDEVPEDLKNKIIENNPQHEIKFTYSIRMKTQMFVSGFLLNKKRGPLMGENGRTISWKCCVIGCYYYTLTREGSFKASKVEHNHEKKPELFDKNEARYQVKKKISESPLNLPMSGLIKETHPKSLGSFSNQECLKQSGRRFKRKLKQEAFIKKEEILVPDMVGCLDFVSAEELPDISLQLSELS